MFHVAVSFRSLWYQLMHCTVNKIVDETVALQGTVCITQLPLRSWQTEPALELKPVARPPPKKSNY